MLRIRTLGGLWIERDGVPLDSFAAQRKALALLALLAGSTTGGLSRDVILAQLWPESDEDRARNALNQLLFTLRRQLASPDLFVGTSELKLNAAVASTDVADFDRAIARGDREAAVDIYGGPFLEGFNLPGASEFEIWASQVRARLAQRHGSVLRALAVDAERAGKPELAVDWWRRLAAAEPTSSQVALSLMAALVESGDTTAAVQHARLHERYVRQVLEADPDPAVAAFVERVRRDPDARRVDDPPASNREPAESPPPSSSVMPAGAQTSDAVRRAPWLRRHWALAGAALVVIAGIPTALNLGWLRAPRGTVVPSARTMASAAGSTEKPRPHSPLGPATTNGMGGLATPSGATASASAADTGHSDPPVGVGRVLVLPFENETGDTSLTVFGRIAANWVADGLAQTGLVDVIDAQTVALLVGPVRDDSGRAGAVTYSREPAARSGARTVITGRFRRSGSGFEVRSRVVEASSGRVIRVVPPVAAVGPEPTGTLGALRRAVGGTLAALADPKLATLTDAQTSPPTFDAYREFIAGLDHFARQDYPKAIPFFASAATLDSSWVLPQFWLAFAFGNSGQRASSDSVIDLVARRPLEQLSPLDRHSLAYFLAHRRNDREAAYLAARGASQLAPRSNWTYLRGSLAWQLSRPREALSALRELDPEYGWVRGWQPYVDVLVDVLHRLGRYREELAEALREARRQQRHGEVRRTVVTPRLRALVGLGDTAALRVLVDSLTTAWASGPNEVWVMGMLGVVALELGAHGRFSEAQRVYERCLAWPYVTDTNTVRTDRLLFARNDCLYGARRWEEARVATEQYIAMKGVPSGGVRAGLGRLARLAVRRGDTASVARHLASRLALLPAERRGVDSLYMEAVFAAIRGDKAKAVHLVRAAQPTGTPPFGLHYDIDFQPLLDYGPLRALIAPRG